jgi:hypothetical protein
MRSFWLLALVVLAAIGCGSPAEKMQTRQAATWPALETLQQDVIIGAGMEMEMAGPQQAQRTMAMPHVAKVIDDFANEAIPSRFATATREAAKKEVVENLRKFSEGGSDDELKALWQDVMAAVQTLTAP